MTHVYLIKTRGCVKCMMLQQYLIEHDVFFEAYDAISPIASEFLDTHKEVTSLPVLVDVTNHDKYITGFNPVEINKFLEEV